MSATPSLDVLLLDGHYRQALTCMRVYARMGLAVGLVACESDAGLFTSSRSRWCAMSATVPDFQRDPDGYIDAILDLVDRTGATMVLPAHDGSIEAVRRRREAFAPPCALPLAADNALDIALSKEKTLALASDLGIRVPESIVVSDPAEARAATAHSGLPAVLKPQTPWVVNEAGVGTRIGCAMVASADDADRGLELMLEAGASSALLQPWLPGRREAISLFRAHGRVWARFAQVSHREHPILGGAAVLCESIPLPPDVTDSSDRLVEAMDLDGCSMVEFRRDRDGRPVLMEVNARMGSSVALPVRAGVDFPTLLHDWASGRELQPVAGYRVGERLRWLAGDLWYLNTALARHPWPDVPTPSGAVKTVLSDFVVRPSRIDRSSITDPMPVLAELRHAVRTHAVPKVRRAFDQVRKEKVSESALPGSTVDVAIIGAGAYGLSIAAHLQDRGIEHRIFGTPMQAWRSMSAGMHLKSVGFATSIRTPDDFLTLPEYCRAHGEEDHEPIPIATFAEYGVTVQQQVVPQLEQVDVLELHRERGLFQLTLSNGERAAARQVVIAIGLSHFERVPHPFNRLPDELVCHTALRGDFTGFEGWDVTVIGAGQSALQAGALLHEHGAEVRLLAREDIKWGGRGALDSERPLIDRIKNPMTVLGHGRDNWKLQHVPWWLHAQTDEKRLEYLRTHLGPGGAWWLRDRVEGLFDVETNSKVVDAQPEGDKVRLVVATDGEVRDVLTEYVVLGTGYDVDVDRIPFVDPRLARQVVRIERAPRLDRHFQSSVPGLYFVGPSTAPSFGPLFRFVAGSAYCVPVVARHLSRRLRSS